MILPPGHLWTAEADTDATSGPGPQRMGALVHILPFMELNNLDAMILPTRDRRRFGNDGAGQGNWWNYNLAGGATSRFASLNKVSSFQCPSDSATPDLIFLGIHAQLQSATTWNFTLSWFGSPTGNPNIFSTTDTVGHTNYVACQGAYGRDGAMGVFVPTGAFWANHVGIFMNRSDTKFGGISDGTSNVIAYGETTQYESDWPAQHIYMVPWISDTCYAMGAWNTTSLAYRHTQFKSNHPGTVNFAMADASVQSIPNGAAIIPLLHLSGMRDGFVVSLSEVK
jgi:prepilin-type processing-associated H-X9-DG protein